MEQQETYGLSPAVLDRIWNSPNPHAPVASAQSMVQSRVSTPKRGIDVSAMLHETVDATLSILDVELPVTYRPKAIATSDIIMAESGNIKFTQVADFIVRVVVRWDLCDGDEEIPVTAETVAAQHPVLLTAIYMALIEDMTGPNRSTLSFRGT